MRDEKRFYQLLKPLHRQLVLEVFLKNLQIYIVCLAGIWFIWMLLGRFLLLFNLSNFLSIAVFLATGFCTIKFFRERPPWKTTVLLMNRFVPDDLIITAYAVLGKEGVLERLIVRDGNRAIEQHLEKALQRKKRYVSPSLLLLSFLFAGAGFLSSMFPNEMLELNRQYEQEKQAVRQFKEEAKEKLQDENDTLEQVREELEKAGTVEEIGEILEKAYRELELAEQIEKDRLDDLKRNFAAAGLADLAVSLDEGEEDAVLEQLEKLQDDFSSLAPEAQEALTTAFGDDFPTKDEKEIQTAVDEVLKQEVGSQQERKTTLQDLTASLNETLKKHGVAKIAPSLQPDDPSRFTAGTSSSGNQLESRSQQSETGLPDSSSAPSTSGGDTGGGTVAPGQEALPGSGTERNGSGAGTSAGAGFGTGSASRMLSIPESIDGEIRIEEDFGMLSEGEAQSRYRAGGRVLRGELRPYEEVFSQYHEAVTHSIDRIQLPLELEEVVKNYFSSVKP